MISGFARLGQSLHCALRGAQDGPIPIPDSAHGIECVVGMELTLNLGWALLAALMAYLWLRHGPREGVSRATQLVALAVLLAILFPAISVSDDLQALHNPAEIDTSVRRTHVAANPHSILPTVVAYIQPMLAALSLGTPQFAGSREAPLVSENRPFLTEVSNRPPPASL